MEKANLEKLSLEELKDLLAKGGESDASRFLCNTLLGYALLEEAEFKTPEETLLAKCFYCQTIEHDGNVGMCPNINCPLLHFMCNERQVKGVTLVPKTVN